jgi:hypothetical protein
LGDNGCPDEYGAKRTTRESSDLQVDLERLDLTTKRVAPDTHVEAAD